MVWQGRGKAGEGREPKEAGKEGVVWKGGGKGRKGGEPQEAREEGLVWQERASGGREPQEAREEGMVRQAGVPAGQRGGQRAGEEGGGGGGRQGVVLVRQRQQAGRGDQAERCGQEGGGGLQDLWKDDQPQHRPEPQVQEGGEEEQGDAGQPGEEHGEGVQRVHQGH